MRFNSKGGYNVPFGHKPERFAQAYITKIINQISWIKKMMKGKDWVFEVADWRQTLIQAKEVDFVYLDPPYIGRHADYYNNWTEKDAIELAEVAKRLPCGFALSMWLENKYRKNEHIENHWDGLELRSFSHFYHVGSSEDLRNEMQEALVLPGKNLNNIPLQIKQDIEHPIQFKLFE
jgi:DNA adenine methylase